MKRRPLLLLLLALAACGSPLFALDFRLLGWDGDIEGLKYADGKTPVAVTVPAGSLSPRYSHDDPGPLIFYREVEREGRLVRQPVATLEAPAGIRQAIILLTYADAARQTLLGFWIDDSPEARPRQSVTYQNLSSYPLAVRLGDAEQLLPPRSVCTRPTDPAVKRVLLKVAAQTASGWQLIASTVQPVRPGLRTLVILRDGHPDHTGQKSLVDMVAFSDYPAPPSRLAAH